MLDKSMARNILRFFTSSTQTNSFLTPISPAVSALRSSGLQPSRRFSSQETEENSPRPKRITSATNNIYRVTPEWQAQFNVGEASRADMQRQLFAHLKDAELRVPTDPDAGSEVDEFGKKKRIPVEYKKDALVSALVGRIPELGTGNTIRNYDVMKIVAAHAVPEIQVVDGKVVKSPLRRLDNSDPSVPKRSLKSYDTTKAPAALLSYVYRVSPAWTEVFGRTEGTRTDLGNDLWTHLKEKKLRLEDAPEKEYVDKNGNAKTKKVPYYLKDAAIGKLCEMMPELQSANMISSTDVLKIVSKHVVPEVVEVDGKPKNVPFKVLTWEQILANQK